MLPCFSFANAPNRVRTDAVHCGQILVGPFAGANSMDSAFVQFCEMLSLSLVESIFLDVASDMLPCSPGSNTRNSVMADTQLIRPILQRARSVCANAKNVVLRKACEVLIDSFGLPTLCQHVIHVFLMRAKKQVRRVYTVSNVATVQHILPLRDRPVFEFIGNSMSAKRVVPVYPVAVAIGGVDCAMPKPALIRRSDRHAIPEKIVHPSCVTGRTD